ncbi:hypothetical protein [Saccharospirillum alexandrii]|uniref:hypothetical protein n=1 Tax=Saccharospirillum alexandrii TaxID=2448477 RepID=UPI000FD9BF27|nr:hypothetical protein [Saccharospirillum alexandrii]
MNKYQKAMFNAYWFPVTLFYVFPNVVLMFLAWPLKVSEVVQYFIPFLVVFFLTGFLLAPFIGPKVVSHKGWSFFMAFICMFTALLAYIFGMSAPNFEHLEFGLIIVLFLAILGIFPTLLGGMFYIGACERVSKVT